MTDMKLKNYQEEIGEDSLKGHDAARLVLLSG